MSRRKLAEVEFQISEALRAPLRGVAGAEWLAQLRAEKRRIAESLMRSRAGVPGSLFVALEMERLPGAIPRYDAERTLYHVTVEPSGELA